MVYVVATELVKQVIQYGQENSTSVSELLAQHELFISIQKEQSPYVPMQDFERLLELCLPLLKYKDPLLGLTFAESKSMVIFGQVAGFLVKTSPTVRSVIETLLRFEPMMGDVGVTKVSHHPGYTRLNWECRFENSLVRKHTTEFLLAFYCWALRGGASTGFKVVDSVAVKHSAPLKGSILDQYIETFGCPVYFGQPQNSINLRNHVLDWQLPNADPDLNAVLEQHARSMLASRTQTEIHFVDHARSKLRYLVLRGMASREKLAEELNMSSRTLARHLREAGLTYRILLDELRLELVKHLLCESSYNIQQISEQAGFEESQSFTRWFRHVTGMPPSEYRRQGSLDIKQHSMA